MTEASWQGLPPKLAPDQALIDAVIAAHREILLRELSATMGLNSALPVQERAFRRIEGWRVLLVVTPWMFARLLFADEPPTVKIPVDWSASARRVSKYCVLGPRLDFELLGQPQHAHLNYHLSLGHYLIQPICLDMEPYPDVEAVLEAWDRVIQVRNENMERAQHDCPLQREVSRREFFGRSRS